MFDWNYDEDMYALDLEEAQRKQQEEQYKRYQESFNNMSDEERAALERLQKYGQGRFDSSWF